MCPYDRAVDSQNKCVCVRERVRMCLRDTDRRESRERQEF